MSGMRSMINGSSLKILLGLKIKRMLSFKLPGYFSLYLIEIIEIEIIILLLFPEEEFQFIFFSLHLNLSLLI